MPEPGSSEYDTQRARRREDVERRGARVQLANEETVDSRRKAPDPRAKGPHTGHGHGDDPRDEHTEQLPETD